MTSALEWREMIQRAKADIKGANDEAEESAAEPLQIIEACIPVGVKVASTPKRIMRNAQEAGFQLEAYGSRVAFEPTYFKTGDRKGELKKPAFEQENLFLGGHVPGVGARFHASWLGTKFSAHVWDPVGRYRYADSRRENERETEWMEKSSRAFEQWLGEWANLLASMTNKEAA